MPIALEYNLVEVMKKYCANIAIFELTSIVSQWEMFVQALARSPSGDNAYPSQKVSTKYFGPLQSDVNAPTLEANNLFLLFLLSFEIFNHNVHNCLVNSNASLNVRLLSVAKKINSKWDKADAYIIHLDGSRVQATRELKNDVIHLSSDQQVQKCINIMIVDMREGYNVLLSKEYLMKVQGNFATDWSHLWLPYKGEYNHI